MTEPGQRLPNFKVFRDVRLDSVLIRNSLTVDGRVEHPSSNTVSSRIYNDQTYDNAVVSGVMELCGADITIPTTDEEWDAYRQQAARIENANAQRSKATDVLWSSNTDETNVPMYIGMFSKALPHNAQGRVDAAAYEALRDGIEGRDVDVLSSVPISGTIKLVGPLGGLLLNLFGGASSTIPLPAAPSISSAESAGEMVECYCQAICRDVSFVDFSTDPAVANCIGYLNALSNFKGPKPVTAANIFRGLGYGDLVGPYLSQIFFLDNKLWPYTIPAEVDFPTRSTANDRMISAATYLSVQNGTVTEPEPTLSGTPTYPSTGRDMAYNVWKDGPGQWFAYAVLRAYEEGAPFSPLNPYNNTPLSNNQEAFVSWSLVDLLSCLYSTAQVALTGAWYGKWFVNRRLRPEAFGNEVEQQRLTGTNPANLHPDVLTSGATAAILASNGNNYLPQAYPEGSPVHPSYPAGHAVASGACITVIKAFMDGDWVFPNPMEPNSAGTVLNPIVASLTLAGEMNKLASNIALGRDWAGVHYRSDGHEGIMMGEKIGVCCLQDWINRYPETTAQFTLKGYMGNTITITPTQEFAKDIQNP